MVTASTHVSTAQSNFATVLQESIRLSAELARKIGKYDDALRLCARVITAKNVNDRIKEKARDMKDRIYEATGRKES